jgi:hypothetical protein
MGEARAIMLKFARSMTAIAAANMNDTVPGRRHRIVTEQAVPCHD